MNKEEQQEENRKKIIIINKKSKSKDLSATQISYDAALILLSDLPTTETSLIFALKIHLDNVR